MTPADHRTADELAVCAPLEQDIAVPVNMRRHGNLIAWAKERSLFGRVDRETPLGNQFVIGRDGDRATVIAGTATTTCRASPTCSRGSASSRPLRLCLRSEQPSRSQWQADRG